MVKLKHQYSGESPKVEVPPGIEPSTRALGGSGAYVHGEGMGRVRLTDVVANFRMVRGTTKGDASKEAMLREGLMLAGMRHSDRDPMVISMNTKLRMAMGEMTLREGKARIAEARALERRDRLESELAFHHMELENSRLELGDLLEKRAERVLTNAGRGDAIPEAERVAQATERYFRDAEAAGTLSQALTEAVRESREARMKTFTEKAPEVVRTETGREFLQHHLGWGKDKYDAAQHEAQAAWEAKGKAWDQQAVNDWQFGVIRAEIMASEDPHLAQAYESLLHANEQFSPMASNPESLLEEPGKTRAGFKERVLEYVQARENGDPHDAEAAMNLWLEERAMLDPDQRRVFMESVHESLLEGQMASWQTYLDQEDRFVPTDEARALRAEEESARIQHAKDVLDMAAREGISFSRDVAAYFPEGKGDEAAMELLYGDKAFDATGPNRDLKAFFEPRPRDSHADVLDEMGCLNADEVIKRLREQRAFLLRKAGKKLEDSDADRERFRALEKRVRMSVDKINTAIELGGVPSLYEQRARQSLKRNIQIPGDDYRVKMDGIRKNLREIASDDATYMGGFAEACKKVAEVDPEDLRGFKERWKDYKRSRTAKEVVRDAAGHLAGHLRRRSSDAHDIWNSTGMTHVRKSAVTLKAGVVGAWDVTKHLAEALLRLIEQSANGLHQVSEGMRAAGRGDGGGAASNMVGGVMALGRAPVSAAMDAATGIEKAHDTAGEVRGARHKTTDAKNRSMSLIREKLSLIKSGKDENVAQAQEMVKSVHEYTETVKELLDKAGDMVGGATEKDRKAATREVKVLTENLEENLRVIERDNPGMAETIRKHTLVSPEAVTRAIESVSAAGAHRNNRVRKALVSCGLTAEGAHGEFSSVVDFGEWGNNSAIDAIRRGGRANSESLDDPLASEGQDTPKGMTVGQPRLAMAIGGDGVATFNLVGCQDWGEPHHSEGAPLGQIRVKDMEALWQCLQPEVLGGSGRAAQLKALEGFKADVSKRIGTVLKSDTRAAQDLQGVLGSIETMEGMVRVAEAGGIPRRQLDAMREIHRMGKSLNGNFAALTISNRSHQEMVKRFNDIVRGGEESRGTSAGQGVDGASGPGLRRERMERDIESNRLRWPGGWSVDPVILVNAHLNQVHNNLEALKSMNTYQKMKAFMRRHHRVRQERDEMVEAASILQIG